MRRPLSIVTGCAANTPTDHLDALLAAGVAEVYVGYVPQRWLRRFGAEVSPNRRYFVDRQFTAPEQVADVVRRAHAAGAAVTLTLNEHATTGPTAALTLALAEEAVALGVDGFIVADLELVPALRRRFPDRARIMSNEAALYNASAAALAVELGATRLVFPREMRLSEMAAIAAHVRTLDTPPELEAFIAREYCVNASSLCTVSHGYGRRTHFCFAHHTRELFDLETGQAHTMSNAPAGWSSEPAFLAAISDLHRCGLCAIEPLRAMGVAFLKVPGRSDSALPAVRRLTALLAEPDQSPQRCRRSIGSTAFCAGHHCYYHLEPTATPTASPVRATPQAAPSEPSEQADGRRELSVYLSVGDWTPNDLEVLAHGGLAALLALRRGLPWEHEIATRGLAALAELGFDPAVPPARVHLGLELCGLRLPRPAAVVHQVALARSAGFAVSVVAPVAFQACWEPLTQIVAALEAPGAHGLPELVVNDYGLLAAVSGGPLPLATGRVFNRMKRHTLAGSAADQPDLTGIDEVDVDEPLDAGDPIDALRRRQHAVYGAPYLSAPATAARLRQLGIRRIAFDALPTPLAGPLPDGFGLDLYAPWTYLTATRACPVAAHFEGASTSTPTVCCEKPCQRSMIRSSFDWRGVVAQRGVGTFLSVDTWPAFARSLGAPLRLVFQPRVPV